MRSSGNGKISARTGSIPGAAKLQRPRTVAANQVDRYQTRLDGVMAVGFCSSLDMSSTLIDMGGEREDEGKSDVKGTRGRYGR